MASSQSDIVLYYPPKWRQWRQHLPEVDVIVWSLSATGAVLMGGDSVTLAPEMYVPGLIIWALTLAWKAWRSTRRADEQARDARLKEQDATIRELRSDLRKANDEIRELGRDLAGSRAQESATVRLAVNILETHNLPTKALTGDK